MRIGHEAGNFRWLEQRLGGAEMGDVIRAQEFLHPRLPLPAEASLVMIGDLDAQERFYARS